MARTSPTRRVNFPSTFRRLATDPADSARRKRPCDQGLYWWALRDSNPRPLPCKGMFRQARPCRPRDLPGGEPTPRTGDDRCGLLPLTRKTLAPRVFSRYRILDLPPSATPRPHHPNHTEERSFDRLPFGVAWCRPVQVRSHSRGRSCCPVLSCAFPSGSTAGSTGTA